MIDFITDELWLPAKDGDERAAWLYKRHYSAYVYKDNRRNVYGYRNKFLIMWPGEKMLLMTPDCKALFAWQKFIDKSGQTGVNCAIFRNEGAFEGKIKSSELILEAEKHAFNRWGHTRLYTYVNAAKVLSKNPGYCFRVAMWDKCGISGNGLLIFEKYI